MDFDFDSLILFRRHTIQFLIETGKQSKQMHACTNADTDARKERESHTGVQYLYCI